MASGWLSVVTVKIARVWKPASTARVMLRSNGFQVPGPRMVSWVSRRAPSMEKLKESSRSSRTGHVFGGMRPLEVRTVL